MTGAVIQIEGLRKTYQDGWLRRRNVEALGGVSFAVSRGEIFGLLGPNGAGKTTLIKILMGIVRKSGGEAHVLGHKAGTRSIRAKIGYLPESHYIPRHLTGNTALEYFGGLSELSMTDIRKRRPELLEIVGLSDWGDTSVRKYSKGMLQRLGLAETMLHDPELIILDEPTDGVDPLGRAEIRKVLKQLKDRGKTVFLNSHLLQEIELVSDRVAILDRGQLRRVAGIEELTKSETESEFVVDGQEEGIRQALDSFRIHDWKQLDDSHFSVMVTTDTPEMVNQVIDSLRASEVGIRSISPRASSLEEAFIEIIREQAEQA